MIYFIPRIATSIYTVLDKTLIGAITHSNAENGYYEQATKIIKMAEAVTFTSLNSVFGARISYLYAGEKHKEIKQKIDLSIDYILFMGIGICAGMVAIADTFIPFFFGKGYEGSVSMLRFLSPVIVIIGVSNCLGSQYYTPSGRRSQSAKYIIAGSFVNLCFNLLLIPQFKGLGAVVATLVAEGSITFLYVHNSNRMVDLELLIQKGWKKVVAAVVMFGTLYGINQIGMNGLLKVALELSIGGFIYIACLFVLRDSFIAYGINKLKHRH